MYYAIILALILILLAVWLTSTKRRLAAMEENIGNAMNQLGVQMSSRFDALFSLLAIARLYAPHEAQTLIEAVRVRRSAITACSTPEDVIRQRDVIADAAMCLSALTEQYPDITRDADYQKRVDAVICYGRMVRTSALIYNDSAAKLNRELHRFPTLLIAGLLGSRERAYLHLPN